jgi:hypothetical protein
MQSYTQLAARALVRNATISFYKSTVSVILIKMLIGVFFALDTGSEA